MVQEVYVVMRDNGEMYEGYSEWPIAICSVKSIADRIAEAEGGWVADETVPYYC